MDEKRGRNRVETTPRLNLDSKFWQAFLTVLAAFLTFAGPTYVVYALVNILNVDYFVSIASGIILFLAGLVLIVYLMRNKIIS